MSSCVASSFTCSPRASSASATSASSPIEGTPPCCHGASPLSTLLPRKTNRKLRWLLPRTRCGAVPSAADRWSLSNDSLLPNSNSVLHRSWPRLHEITRPTHRTVGALQSLSPNCVSITPRPFFTPQSGIAPTATSPVPMPVGSSVTDLDYPNNFYKPLSLHSICISPASAAPAASF